MTKEERKVFAKMLYDQYIDNAKGQISYESLAYQHDVATSTVCRLINRHKLMVEMGKA
jgi:hypothetical protein